jgi:transposase-like protein
MVTKQITCRHCGSIEITRHGLTTNGKQRFLCHDCGRYSRESPQPNGYTAQARETILRAYDERSSLRGLSRTFGVSRNTVTAWLKKAERLPPLTQTLLAPDEEKPETAALELDELWSFVLKRARKRWIWVALCRHTRQVVAYFIGDRSAAIRLLYLRERNQH